MTDTGSDLRSRWLGNPRILFSMLLLRIMLEPLSDTTAAPLSRLLLSFTVAAAVHATCTTPRDRRIAFVLGIPALTAIWWARLSEIGILDLVAFGLVVVLYLFIVARMLLRIVKAESVDGDTLFLAATCFLLIGATWALFYHAVVFLDPSALSGISESTDIALRPDLYYFR
jgi:hypothetical protein